MSKYEQIREQMTLLASQCYSQELSVCSKHPIFQPQKFINLILSLDGIEVREKNSSTKERAS